MAKVVMNMRDARPIWTMPEWVVEELRSALPSGWELQVAQAPADGSGDGGGAVAPEVLDAMPGARIYVGYGIPAPILEAGEDTLEWVHSGAAGVGSSLHDAMRKSRVRFTNSAGIHGPPIAETVTGMLLYFARGLDFAVAAHSRGQWNALPFLSADTPVREVASMTVGILGYGGIGREVARRLRALGSRVLGFRRSAGNAPGARDAPRAGSIGDARAAPRAGSIGDASAVSGARDALHSRGASDAGDQHVDELGVTLLHGEEGLATLLQKSEALVVAAPDTAETRGILTAQRIRALPRGAVVINVARGRLVDEEALVAALREGHLRGAGLDVFWTEPLPEGHPLWTLPNVLLTPHTSAVTREFWRRETDLVLENLRRFLDGGPMLNEVDRERGY